MVNIFPLLCLLLLGGCLSGPDEFNIGYGHQFAGNSTLAECWPIDNEDSDWVTVGFTWRLQPTRVVVENPVAPPVRWSLGPDPGPCQKVPEAASSTVQPPAPTTTKPAEPVPAPSAQAPDPKPEPAHRHTEDVKEALTFFASLDWVTRAMLLVAVCWLGWVYRGRLGRLIPRRRVRPSQSAPADPPPK